MTGRSLVAFVSFMLLLAACADQEADATGLPGATPPPSVALALPSPTASATPPPTPSPTTTPTPAFTAVPTPTATAPAVPPTPTNTPEPSPTFEPGQVILPIIELPIPTPPALADNPLEMSLDGVGLRVNVLRELSTKRPVDRQFLTREELKGRLQKLFEEDRDDILIDQRLYATLGILDRETDLYGLLLNLYGEGVLGYYDADDERFFVLNEGEEFGPASIRTYVHEYVHALQQQHFDFDAEFETREDNSDEAFALRALLEGDASLAEQVYVFQHMDESERNASQSEPSSDLMRAFRAAPNVIQRMFIFPYQEGVFFTFEILRSNGWDGVNQAYEQIPQSTEQVLHPEKYFGRDEPVLVELPDLVAILGEEWTEVLRDTMGEFFLLTYLETGFSPTAATLASEGWGGDAYSLLKGPQDESLLVSSITWDTQGDAQEFFDTFLEFTQVRTGGQWEMAGDESKAEVMTLPDQSIFVGLEGIETLLIYAPDQAAVETVREGLAAAGTVEE